MATEMERALELAAGVNTASIIRAACVGALAEAIVRANIGAGVLS